MFTRWDTCSKRDNMCRNSFLCIFLQNWWPSSGSDQISGGTKQNMEQVWRGIFIWWKVPVCLFFLLGQWCLTTGTKLNCYYSHYWWCCSGRFARTLTRWREGLERFQMRQRSWLSCKGWTLTSPTDLLIQVCFSISQKTLFQYVQLFIYICTIVIWSATIFSPILHHFHLTF